VRQDVFRVARAQRALFAYVDTLAKGLLTCVAEPPPKPGRAPSHAPKSARKGWLRAPGAPWSANQSWQWKTSSPISSGHNGCLHILRYNALSTVHEMADDPQPNKIPLIFFRTLPAASRYGNG